MIDHNKNAEIAFRYVFFMTASYLLISQEWLRVSVHLLYFVIVFGTCFFYDKWKLRKMKKDNQRRISNRFIGIDPAVGDESVKVRYKDGRFERI